MRKKNEEYEILVRLKTRMILDYEMQHYLENLEKGWQGEIYFDQQLENLTCQHILLKDVRLKMDQHYFQIDSLLITGKQVIVFEIKNWGGTFDYIDNQIVSRKFNKPYKNPLEQLSRCTNNLQYLIKKWGFDFEVLGRVVFVNPSFYLYQVPPGLPFLFRPELEEWIRGLNQFRGLVDNSQQSLADWIVNHYQSVQLDRTLLPEYNWTGIQKGSPCKICYSFSTRIVGYHLFCAGCGYKEKNKDAIKRLADDFSYLFPDFNLTTDKLYQFCGECFSKKQIQRHLVVLFEQVGSKKGAYYRL